MSHFLLWAVLVGPYSDFDKYQLDMLSQLPKYTFEITILTSVKSLDKEVERRSKIVLYELHKAPNHQFRKSYLNIIADIKIIDWFEAKYPEVPSLPCFKIGKNGQWESFPEHTFLASGTFIQTLCSIIYVENYITIFHDFERAIDIYWRQNYEDLDQSKMPLPPFFHKWFVLPEYYKFNKTPEYSKLDEIGD